MKARWTRKIIHVDMDAFFAAVEMRDNPSLRGKPVIVGNPTGRSVVSTASYEARRFGVRSAMPVAVAKRLCPKAIFIRPNFRKYEEASREVMAILHQHTDLVEPVSLDEAYLDVTRHKLGIDDPVMVARLIKQNIVAVTKLTASAGVATNPFLAKVASDMNKPDGLTVVLPGEEKDFVKDLPVRKIPGVGPVTEKRLHDKGIEKCKDILQFGMNFLVKEFGKFGPVLQERAKGMDPSPVSIPGIPKQISSEETFDRDTKNTAFLKSELRRLSEDVYASLDSQGLEGRTVVLKIKYHDFELITRSHTLNHSIRAADEIYQNACELLQNKTQVGKKAVRLIGVGVSGLGEPNVKPVAPTRDLFAM